MPKTNEILSRAGDAAVIKAANELAAAANSGGWRKVWAALKSTTLWSAVGIAGVLGSGLAGALNPESIITGVSGLLIPIITERIKKL